MLKKRLVKYNSIIAVLIALLIIVVSIGSTFAWFAGKDEADKQLVMGDAVILNMVDGDGEKIPDGAPLPIEIPSEYLLPGMSVLTQARVKFTNSNTPALLRASLTLQVGGEGITQEDLAYLQEQININLQSIIATTGNNKWALYNGWWYYLGSNNNVETSGGNIENSICESINCENGATIDFINNYFQIPKSLDNRFANASIKFTVEFQGIQAIFFDEDPTNPDQLPNTIKLAEEKLNEAFPIN